jgi:hypothetical protein
MREFQSDVEYSVGFNCVRVFHTMQIAIHSAALPSATLNLPDENCGSGDRNHLGHGTADRS